jgi:hypothetical protein
MESLSLTFAKNGSEEAVGQIKPIFSKWIALNVASLQSRNTDLLTRTLS